MNFVHAPCKRCNRPCTVKTEHPVDDPFIFDIIFIICDSCKRFENALSRREELKGGLSIVDYDEEHGKLSLSNLDNKGEK